MWRPVSDDNVIADFQPQSDPVFEPPIHTSAYVDRGSGASAKEQRISAGYEWRESARPGRVREVVRNIGREDAKALAQIFYKAEVADLGAHAEPFIYQPFAASADMQGCDFSRKDSGRDEDIPLSAPLFVLS